MHPLVLVLLVYAAFMTVMAILFLTRERGEKRRQKQEPAVAAPAKLKAAAAPARPPYTPADYAMPARHTPSIHHAPQPQQGGMTAGEAFLVGALIASSWDNCSRDSSAGNCDDGGWNWC
jgi:hypothetical protein